MSCLVRMVSVEAFMTWTNIIKLYNSTCAILSSWCSVLCLVVLVWSLLRFLEEFCLMILCTLFFVLSINSF